MSTAGTVDVILPTHRRPHTIAYAVASVLGQTYPAFLLHVVGDGCDETTERIVRDIGDPRVRFSRFPKARGVGYANRNHVLRETTGDLIAYASDDDLWFPDHLERGVRELRARDAALVCFQQRVVCSTHEVDPYFFAFDWRLPLVAPFLRAWFTSVTSAVHYRWIFGRVGYWNDRLARFGDREFHRRVRRSGIPHVDSDEVTALRFHALHWDARYASLAEPPQKAYLERLKNPAWCREARRPVAPGRRPLAVRRRQLGDVLAFARTSGPRFVRFWFEQARMRRRQDAARS